MNLPIFEDFEREFKSQVWLEAATKICQKHHLSFRQARRAEQGECVVILIDDRFVIKIYVPERGLLKREITALENARTSLTIPEIAAFGEIEGYEYLITTQLAGELMTKEMWLELGEREQIRILARLAEGLKELHRGDASKIDFDWNEFIARQAATCFERQKACGVNPKVLAEIAVYLEKNLKLLPARADQVFLHGDVHFGNLRLKKVGENWQISGLFDFAESLKGFYEFDFLAVCVLMIQGQGNLQREFFRAYGYADREINDELRQRQMLLTMFYDGGDLRRYAMRLRPEAVEYSLIELERAIWNF